MYMDIVILSHLQRGPIHGYELKRAVSRTTAYALHNNTLYPALRRFEEAGAVTKTAETLPGRPPRHVYEITELGRELLHDMLADLTPEQAADENEFLTRLGQFEHLTPDERRGILAARVAALGVQKSHMHDLAERSIRARDHEWGRLVVTELADRIDRELAWLERLTTLVDEPCAS